MSRLIISRCVGAVMTWVVSGDSTGWVELEPLVSPSLPLPQTYAAVDAEKYATWTRQGYSAWHKPTDLTAFDELVWEQWHRPQCHDVAHALGQEIYSLEVGDDNTRLLAAVSKCEYRCTGGCLHGVLGAFLQNSMRRTTHSAVGSSVIQACRPPQPLSHFLPIGECAHALGHALVVSSGNPYDALEFCDSAFQSVNHNRSLAHYCATGVVMQSGSRITEGRHPLHDCAKLPATAHAACYYYNLRSNWKRNPPIHVICRHIASPESCAFGAAAAATFFSSNRVRAGLSAVSMCESFGDRRKRACIDGLVFRASKYFADIEVDRICGAFRDAADSRFCFNVSRAGMYSMGKERLIATYQRECPCADPPFLPGNFSYIS